MCDYIHLAGKESHPCCPETHFHVVEFACSDDDILQFFVEYTKRMSMNLVPIKTTICLLIVANSV